MVQGVEVEVEGERWVTDLVPDEEATGSTPKKSRFAGSGWAEGSGQQAVGEWRRRRWIRMVRRKGVSSSININKA